MPPAVFVDALVSAVDGLLSSDLSALSAADAASLVGVLEAQRRRLDAVDARVLTDMRERGLAGELGRASVADVLVQTHHVAPAEAKARVRRAEVLGPRRTVPGDPLPPLLPATASALAAGTVSAAHAREIQLVLDRLDPIAAQHGPGFAATVEHALVDYAARVHPGLVRGFGQELVARLDPDGVEPAEERSRRRRDLRVQRFADGSGKISGYLTAEALALLEVVFDSLAAPQHGATTPDPSNDATADAETATANTVTATATAGAEPVRMRDERSRGQRQHDALVESLLRILRSGELPACGGVPATLILTTQEADLTDHLEHGHGGTVATGHGQRLSLASALRLVGDGGSVLGVRFDQHGAVLSCGRERRLATRPQRLALAARDGGCSFPGCDRPPAWTEVHHVIPWQHGGRTDLDNMTLVCSYHHAHFEQAGWQARMHHGVPEWLAPVWLDPDQTWQTNPARHPPDIHFGPPEPLGLRTRRSECDQCLRRRDRGGVRRTLGSVDLAVR